MTQQSTGGVLNRAQARITLPPPFLSVIDPIRLRWDPARAKGNPAHATIVYHDELRDFEQLILRVREAAVATQPFTLVLEQAERFAPPDRGAYLQVRDPGRVVATLRRALLAPPATPRTRFGLHVTVLHPAAGDHLDEAWPEISRIPALGPFAIQELQIIGDGNAVIDRIPLGRH